MSLAIDTQVHAGPSRSTAGRSRPRGSEEVSKPKPKPEPIPYIPGTHPESDEQAAVHEVYEKIAPHFSQTRHKPWPLISSFLHSQPPNSIGLDSGGGNGKYVPVAREAGLSMVVMDRSLGLLGDARKQPGFGSRQSGVNGYVDGLQDGGGAGECVRGDLTSEGWRRGVFDFAISIAAIHHLSTPERRRRSVQALIYPLVHSPQPPYSRFLIYVWAYEQSDKSKRRMGATAAPSNNEPATQREIGENEDGKQEGEARKERVQDVLVPWVLQNRAKPKPKSGSKTDITPNPTSTSMTGNSDSTAACIPAKTAQIGSTVIESGEGEPGTQVFHRYYHLFVRGELRELVEEAVKEEGYVLRDGQDSAGLGVPGGVGAGDKDEAEGGGKWFRVVKEGWEADNWWLEGEVGLC